MAGERPPEDPDRIPTGVELTALDPTFRTDPHPVLARLRRDEPAHYDGVINRWVLTRHDDVERVLRDRTMSLDPHKANEGTYMRLFLPPPGQAANMLFSDPPDHTRLRALVNKAFTPRAVERLAPRIRRIIGELLDPVAGGEGFDLIEAFAGPLPVIVIAEMLGIDPADRDEFKRWSELDVRTFNPFLSDEERASVISALGERDAYLRRVLARRRAEPRDDLLSALIAAEEAGDRLDDDEIVTMCELLLVAGNVTTTDLIGNGVWILLRHPEEERPDLEAVVAALPAYLRDFTRFAYLTGWRKGEIISLKWTDVDRDAGAIRLRPEAAKTGRGRTVMLEGDLAELIARRWQARLFEEHGNVGVAGLVFHRNGEPVGDFLKAWATACQVAGVPDKLFHDLRRTAARNMVRAGVPERVAMAVTGHVTRSMFDRYNIVSEEDLRMATQKTTMYVDTLPTKREPV